MLQREVRRPNKVPLYEYLCPKDGTFELVRKFSDPPLAACPTCGGPIEKLVSAPAIQFKGTGWYITDYARKSTGGEAAGNKDAGSKDSGSKDSGSKDSGSKESGSKDAGSKDKGSSGSSDTPKATSSSSSSSESKTSSSAKDSAKK
jgi:putative FmdB family regulatory protein